MDLSHKEEEFWIKRSKKEEEAFFARILAGLLDALSEVEGEVEKINRLPPERRTGDQKLFLDHYQAIQLELKRLEETKLSFDQKYEIAQRIQGKLTDMTLL